jgi:GWxTD domain-containing protein
MIRSLVAAALLFWLAPSPGIAGTPRHQVSREEAQRLSPSAREVLAGLQYLLNAQQIRQYMSLSSDEERAKWVDRFWLLNDPTPTTPENEMRTEHLIRAGLSREYFASRDWPGWDRRGEVFIRYGAPDFRGKIWGEVTIKKFYPPGELWYYRRHDMLVSFEQSGKGNEYIYAVEPLGAAENITPDLAEYLLYDTNESLAEKIPQDLLEFYEAPATDDRYRTLGDTQRETEYLMSKPRDLPENIDAIMSPNLAYELPRDISAAFDKDRIQEVANNFEATVEDTPTSYPFNFNREELPFFFGVDQFRGGEGTNRVDVQIEVPVSVEKGDTLEETYTAEVVIWDANLAEVARRQREIVVHAAPGGAEWANLIPTQTVFSLRAGYYRMAVSVRGENSRRESSYRTSFSADSFAPRLALSDILFARKIAQAENVSIFTRGALEVIPHPYRAYSRTFAIPLYFEIYNLALDARGVSSYSIEYAIIRQSSKKQDFLERFRGTPAEVASRFESSSQGENDTQHILVRADNLAKGSYEILVTVKDNLSNQVAYRKGTFSIID